MGGGVRAVEAVNNLSTMRTSAQVTDEIGDTVLDIAFGLAALTPIGIIPSIAYFVVDNFILEKGVFRTFSQMFRREEEVEDN